MEPLMYTAIVRMVEQKKLDEVVSKTADERKMSAKRIQPLEVIEGRLFYGKMRVPSQDDVDRALGPIHEMKGHAINMPTLRDELKKMGFTLPKFMGGLERACNL